MVIKLSGYGILIALINVLAAARQTDLATWASRVIPKTRHFLTSIRVFFRRLYRNGKDEI